MKASLPAGSFSPFDFEKEFHMRHGMNPEDADKPWREYYPPQGMLRRARVSGKERRSVDNENSLAVSLTEDLETLRMPGVVRNLDDTERGLYAENILAFDARLLQDIISGRWSRQQMYGSTPRWYQDSFYDITPRGWDNIENLMHHLKILDHSQPILLDIDIFCWNRHQI